MGVRGGGEKIQLWCWLALTENHAQEMLIYWECDNGLYAYSTPESNLPPE